MSNAAPLAASPAAHHWSRVMEFITWLQREGVTADRVQLQLDGNDRTLVAVSPIAEGSLVMHIPSHLLLTIERAQASPIGQRIQEAGLDLTEWGYLAAFLLDTRRHGAGMQPFVGSLPQAYPDNPVFFTEEELQWLQGSYIEATLRNRRERLYYEYQQLSACLPPESAFSLDDYRWAWCSAQTRYFTSRVRGERIHCMVPLGDMPNHDFAPNMRWQLDPRIGLVMVAAKPIAAGTPLTILYARKSNTELLSDYGFCVDRNPCNLAQVSLPALPEEHPCAEATAEWGRDHGALRAFRVPRDLTSRAVRELWAYARLQALDPAEHGAHRARGWCERALTGPLYAANEHRAAHAIAQACDAALAAFADPVEEDSRLLLRRDLAYRQRCAIRARQGEKLLLRYHARRARQWADEPG